MWECVYSLFKIIAITEEMGTGALVRRTFVLDPKGI